MGGFLQRLGDAVRRFMAGRYGTDKLNMFILCVAAVLCLLSLFVPSAGFRLGMAICAYGLMFWVIFRCFSRNTYRRYRENRRFLLLLDRLKDRQHKYFDCPQCRQPVRVPKGKGKIAITCPKCAEKFIRKT